MYPKLTPEFFYIPNARRGLNMLLWMEMAAPSFTKKSPYWGITYGGMKSAHPYGVSFL